MKQSTLYAIVVLFFLSACRGKPDGIIRFYLEPSEYVEKITAPGTVKAVNTNYLKAPMLGLSNVSFLKGNGDYAKKGDTVCILELPELINELENNTSDLENLEAELKKLEAGHTLAISMLEAQIENNDIDLAISDLDSVQKKFAPPLQRKLISLQQEKAALIKQKLDKKLLSQKEIAETELRGMKSRIKQQESRIDRLKDEIKMLTITAPADGITVHTEAPILFLMSSRGHTTMGGKIEEGSSVWPNMNLLEMPELSDVQVIALVPESDYKRVEAGQKVKIQVEAVSHLETTGLVNRKMLVGKKVKEESDIKVYEVVIDVDSCDTQMTPGLSASCEIMIHDLKDTLVVPAIAVFEEEDVRYVYVASGKRFNKVVVETGLSNSSQSIIAAGLKGGETIAMSKPPQGLITKIATADSDSSDTAMKEGDLQGHENSDTISDELKLNP